jgi:hypothetical protein
MGQKCTVNIVFLNRVYGFLNFVLSFFKKVLSFSEFRAVLLPKRCCPFWESIGVIFFSGSFYYILLVLQDFLCFEKEEK